MVARLDALAIPPAWKDVRIAPTPRAKLQAVGIDSAGRKQYRYHPDFRAQQEAAKYEELIRFAEKLPDLRLAMGEHLTRDPLDPLHVCAVAIRLINLAWFRVGSDRHTKRSRTYGVTTLNKSHVKVRGTRVTFRFRAKGKVQVRTAVVDVELADSIRALLATPGPPPLPLRGRRRALQPHQPPPERVHPRVHGRRLLRARTSAPGAGR